MSCRPFFQRRETLFSSKTSMPFRGSRFHFFFHQTNSPCSILYQEMMFGKASTETFSISQARLEGRDSSTSILDISSMYPAFRLNAQGRGPTPTRLAVLVIYLPWMISESISIRYFDYSTPNLAGLVFHAYERPLPLFRQDLLAVSTRIPLFLSPNERAVVIL